MVTVPPGHWITLPAASQEKPGVEIRFVNGSTVSDTTRRPPRLCWAQKSLLSSIYISDSIRVCNHH